MRKLVLLVGAFCVLSVVTSAQEVDPTYYQAMEWRNIGPFRGGRSNASTGVPSQPDTFYFGGVGGGVWKTTDGGESWGNISDKFFKTASVGAIAVADSDPNVIYAGMGEHAVRGVMTSHGDGVYKSTDAGRTWEHVGLPNSRAISRIRIHPKDPDRVYVAVQGAPYGPTEDRGIYRSTDGGENWEKVLYVGETAGASGLAMDPTNPRILYAAFWDHLRTPWEVRSGGPGSGIHKSTDGGDHWEKLGEKDFPELMGKTSVTVSADPDRLYVLVEADPGGGVYRSEDAGKSWKNVNENWTIRARAWYYIKIYADPKNPDVVWITNAPLMKSIDAGKTFTRVPNPHGDNHHLWIHPENTDIMINSNDGGANITFNGGKSWSTQRNQPTAQFYRVSTDERYPYYVYGGQQDNSTVAIASKVWGPGIGWKDWYSVGGCESAHIGFDAKSPDLIYAGCYMGQISEWDARTRFTRNVMAYPVLPAALASRDMKYRFNWSAPIVVSQHDPNIVYHAGNVLLRTENRGLKWVEVSPDLTRDDDEKQGPGGGPITNEGAGGEIYGTIYYLAESPKQQGVLWTGSDDGYVHVTRDGAMNWEDVTPDGIGESMINAIEASPHDPATAYIAVTKYKFNDFTPIAFKTDDYGETWTSIAGGIPDQEWIRVVREDPVRRGLLYMGTELGLYVSFDDGGHWQSLQLNLPVVPITDLKVQAQMSDLVAATQGRAFWILDDISPLRELADDLEGEGDYLFAPRAAYRGPTGFSFGSNARLGKNPPDGAIIDYLLKEVTEDTELTVEILDGSETVIRTYSNEKKPGEATAPPGPSGASAPKPLEPKAGMNRMTWDLRHDAPERVPGLYIFGALRGRRVVPGTYRVRLTVDGEVHERDVHVRRDPRLDTTDAAFQEQDAFLETLEAELSAIHESVVEIRAVRTQLEDYMKRAEGHENGEAIQESGQALVDELTEMEDTLIQKRTIDGQTVINFPTKLNHHYIYLHGSVDGSETGLIEGAEDVYSDLTAQWQEHQAALDELLGAELDAFNQLMRQEGIPAVMVPPD